MRGESTLNIEYSPDGKKKAAQVQKCQKCIPSLKRITLLIKETRPVSVLSCISKIYERAIHDQLMDFLDKHFHPDLLSAFSL
jgi:hypothetical protein